MLANATQHLTSDKLTRTLPSLICETNIEKQAENIRNLLNQQFPVHSMGISIEDSENGKNIVAINFKEEMVACIEKSLSKYSQNNSLLTNMPFFFVCCGDDLALCSHPVNRIPSECNGMALYLKNGSKPFGTFLMTTENESLTNYFLDEEQSRWFSSILSSLIYNTWSHHQYQEKIKFYSLYETVSSSLCYAEDLQELLTMIISIIVSEVGSEEGSILLYNEENDQLEFFSAIGETGSGYIQCGFPANRGIAGKVFQEGAPLIVNDVQTCPYFFGNFDNDSGFKTKSILAAPIILGEEKVGVIEAINKVGQDHFEENDKKILIAIADEVGLAVKNAKMFEYVVNSYCKIRQGEGSCKGCVRPLKSWTPCARQLDLV